MRERDVERYLYEQVRRAGGLALKLAPTVVGIPDRLVILPDRPMFFVEVKSPTGRLRPVQSAVHERLRKMGQRVEVIYSPNDVIGLLT